MNDKPEEKVEKANWLQRQVQRVRQGRWRDVIIVQVDDGARNVAAGKYIMQVNVGGRNLALPVIWIALASAIALIGAAYWIGKPIISPSPMQGAFNIAVADFGEMDSDGTIQASQEGKVLSGWFFDQLSNVYGRHEDEFAIVNGAELRHRSNAASSLESTLAVIEGETLEERQAIAAERAARIGAHMFIYGHLVQDGEEPGLDLEFFLSPRAGQSALDPETNSLPGERLAIVGPHRLGRPIALPIPFTTDDPDLNMAVSNLLRTRTDALFWLTTGLAQDILGRPDEALATLQRAEDELPDWQADEGRELLYYFIGRQQLFLDDVDAAQASFNEAVTIAPEYARGYIGLGSVQFKRAQNLSLDWAGLSDEQKQDALGHAQQAIDQYAKAAELALSNGDLLTHSVAQVAQGLGFRLLGQIYTQSQESDQARIAFNAALTYLDVARTYFAETTEYRLLAQVYENSGLANFQLAAVLAALGDPTGQHDHLTDALTSLDLCLELGSRELRFRDEFTNRNVVEKSCRHWRDQVEAALSAADGARP